MPAVRVSSDVHQQLGVVAASENRSVANYVDTVLRPILAAALGDESANGAVEQEPGSASPERVAARGSGRSGSRHVVPSAAPASPGAPAPARPSRDPVQARQAKLNKAKGL
jgi:hypothetical protein